MPRFSYRALVEGGRVVEGRLTSPSRERAVVTLSRRKLVPVSVEEVIAGTDTAPAHGLWSRGGDAGRALFEFTRDFGVLLQAGVPVGRALTIVAETPSGKAALVAERLLGRVRSGASVSAAMEADRVLFPDYYVGMVRAGEEGSSLGEVLGRLTLMLERAEALRAQLRASLAYPAFVLGLGALTMVLMLVFVVPEFRPVFEQSGEVPLSARILLGASGLATGAGWAIALGLAALLLAIRQATRSRAGRLRLDRLALHLPAVGPLIVQVEAARFCRTLGTLVANGVVLMEAARISARVVSNSHLSASTHGLVVGLAEGDDAVRAVGRIGWLPDRVRQAVAVGAESDRLGQMLVRMADLLESEATRSMQRLVGMIAPASTLLLGGMVGLMIWTVFSTVLGSYSQALQ